MPLKDFIVYIKEALIRHAAYIYLEQKTAKDAITTVKLDLNKLDRQVPDNRAQHLNFFISTKELLNKEDSFYEDENMAYAIEGSGGRQDEESLERIALRIISKTPEKSIHALFKQIRNQLKKDPEIGMGVAGNSALHKNYCYQKNLAGKLVFKTDFYNDKAPLITII